MGEYNAVTGATINAALVNGLSAIPQGLAVSNSHIFVSSTNGSTGSNTGSVGAHDAATGSPMNANLVSGYLARGLAVDSNDDLFVTNVYSHTVGEYDATTGALINPTFIGSQGLLDPTGLAARRP